ncbi:Geranylgeranyl pyrophosphate synthase D [Escovopsis weberi]|uniref:Geranylgeranyl pyrophosphate synthase D n=1 Tax=Escovopsis weberi TaxID=150374 RepID=A0A0M8MW46_ESCWE|nr:Geranylgeranyl pyrophosphate synthase D [Escovopsis weberi]
MPTKGVLKATTAALNVWIRAPDASALTIGEVAQHIQQACLLIDDMEDNSSIRRGNPAAHAVFGHAQTLEAANFLFVQTYKQARKMRSQDAIDILLEEVENMMLGQCLDQHWKFELKPPSEEEYLNMVDNKTGAFFRLIIRLLQAETAHERAKALDFERFSTLLGRFYQIRDDLMNLRSGVYAELKGSCEDLDEGKFSYPIVHCLVNSPAHRSHIIGIFRQRPASMGGEPRPLSPQAKSHIMSCLEESGSLDAALGLVNELQADIEAETARLESAAGEQNPTLRALLKKLTLTNGIS